MSSSRAGSIATHVEAAKRLLRELDQHAETALRALGQDNGDEFFAAVAERDGILTQLDGVVSALSEANGSGSGTRETEIVRREREALFADVAAVSARALASHQRLVAETRRERDRLAAALARADRPDSVAHQYAATTNTPRSRTSSSFSVTG